MINLSKKDKLWEIWNNGLSLENGITDPNRAISLIPISFIPNGRDECIMHSELGEVPLTIEEVSRYGIIKDTNALYKFAIYKLLKNKYKLNLQTPESNEKIKSEIIKESETKLFREQTAQLNRIKNMRTPLVFVNGKEKVGKTTLIKTYCCRTWGRGNSAYYLDFNRGYFDFCDFVNNFSALPKGTSNQYGIFLDHLYCCDVEDAEKVLTFFRKLIEVLQKHEIRIKVIVSETIDRKFEESNRNNTVELEFPSEGSSDVKNKLPVQDILIMEHNRKYPHKSVDSIKIGKALFEKVVLHKLETDEMILFYKILTLSRAGFQIILDNEEKKILLKENGLFSKVNGLTVYKNIFKPNSCIVSFFYFDTSKLIQEYLEKEFVSQIGKYQKREICYSYLSDYYDIGTMLPMLKNLIDRNFSLSKENDTFLQDYLYLINYCVERKEKIVEKINSSPEDDILGNHLGRILFALETIVGIKAKSWADQRAIIKIKKLVRNMYFISKEVSLPNINYQYIDKEKTVEDFFTRKDQDSIRTQIELQDILANTYNLFDIECATSMPENTEEFAYYLPELQEKARYIESYEEFFQTYLLALLLEFESTLYYIDPQKERLEMLLDRVCQTARYNKKADDDSETEDNFCYFYPARVPWVTGRMYLAISIFLQKEDNEKVNNLRFKMERWLKKMACEITLGGKECCLWCSGTGHWNTVLDTTILCMSAMQYNESSCFSKAKNYILEREHEWLTPSNITSGISALEILSDTKGPGSIHMLREKIENLVAHNEETEIKSDPSMGDSQIAQKLVDLCMKYKDKAVEILCDRLYGEKEDGKEDQGVTFDKKLKPYIKKEERFKIGISFDGDYRDKYIEPLCRRLKDMGYKEEDIFYDFWHVDKINGTAGDERLTEIYREQCECVAVLLSPEYAKKVWTGKKEWPAILELSHKSKGQRVCLMQVGAVNIDENIGLDSYRTIVQPIDDMSIYEIAEFVHKGYLRASEWIEQQRIYQ